MDTDRDIFATPLWYKVTKGLAHSEATCNLCHQPLQSGQLVADDGDGYIHESCYDAAREDSYE